MIKEKIRNILKKFILPKEDVVFPDGENIKIGKNFIIGKYRNTDVHAEAFVDIGEEVGFREFCNIIVMKNACLKIGKKVYCNNYTSINCLGKITIGENTLIGEGVKMYDHNHKYTYFNNVLKVERTDFLISEIYIGKNVWIGSNSIVLKGVTIGDNVIVGANNLIYKSIPSNTIVKAKTEVILTDLK